MRAYSNVPIEEIIQRFQMNRTLGTNSMIEPAERLGVEIVAVFDHDYMGCHLLMQVTDTSVRPNPWSYQRARLGSQRRRTRT